MAQNKELAEAIKIVFANGITPMVRSSDAEKFTDEAVRDRLYIVADFPQMVSQRKPVGHDHCRRYFYLNLENKTLTEKTKEETDAAIGENRRRLLANPMIAKGGLWFHVQGVAIKADAEMQGFLSDVAGLDFEFNTELKWDTDGAPDGEACDEFNAKLAKLKTQAENISSKFD